MYALSQLRYTLHSPRLLAALGMQVVVNEPRKGLSRKGTTLEGAAFHGDVARKMLKQIEKHDAKGEVVSDTAGAVTAYAPKALANRSLLDW